MKPQPIAALNPPRGPDHPETYAQAVFWGFCLHLLCDPILSGRNCYCGHKRVIGSDYCAEHGGGY